MSEQRHDTREGWLLHAAQRLIAFLPPIEQDIPHISIGPCGGHNIGCCYRKDQSGDGQPHIFISPVFKPEDVATECGILSTLAHELCHAKLEDGQGHGRKFKKLIAEIGLQEPATATTADAFLLAVLTTVADELGPFPHAQLMPKEKKKQTSRMVKLACPDCGMVIRTARKWIASPGAPVCWCSLHDGDGPQFVEATDEDE